ncbi:M24 family metallopeptidase [Micrococcus sp. TA1]|uniref:M24 family metallopeptidase n=1 Tax=Micrococcus sp. TA1 TaxID=681627 RepID=UPI00160E6D5F|nr:M24 family metallopeptidase [Micrococcus sp. TA1]MBB5749505.1 Xaa-Pro aminopeptidase [Micrococcus sp. TA1]
MLRIVCDPQAVADRYGFHPLESMLFTAIRLDSHRFVIPLIAEQDGRDVLLVRQQEQGNVFSAGVSPEQVRFYEPWVTIDARIIEDSEAAPSLPALVRELSGGGAVELDARAPYVHYLGISGEVSVEVPRHGEPRRVVAYAVDKSRVLEAFSSWREEGVRVAKGLIDHVPALHGLENELTHSLDTRYDSLKTLSEDLGVQAVLISSPPNFTELTGIRARQGAFALWTASDERVVIIAEDTVTDLPGVPVGHYASASEAITAIAGTGRLAFEEQWETTGLALELVGHGATLVSASRTLGSWRDLRDHEDLAFQVVAARTSVTAIEKTVQWIHDQLDAGLAISELDAYAEYLRNIQQFRIDHEIPFAVEPYFTNLHSSSRMLFPGPPVDFPIDGETKCVQLDAGVKVTVDGVTLATSDMARSVLRSENGKEAYELLTTAVREGIIDSLRPGMVCEDVHANTLKYLEDVRPRMIEIGLLGHEVDFNAEYSKRNVGHLMGKQESFANELRPGYTHVLTAGSYGAAEIPWRYGDHAIGTEDLWYIGESRTYNLTLR